MKKIFIAWLFPTAAWAGSASQEIVEARANVVDIGYAQRVLHLTPERNSISADGVILVCLHPNTIRDFSNACLGQKRDNQWIDINNVKIPGHELAGFEYRLIGTGGQRNLFLYFKKTNK